jgi:hypothetical protein
MSRPRSPHSAHGPALDCRSHAARLARAALGLALCAATPAGAAEVSLSFREAPGGHAAGFRVERRAPGARKFEPLALVGPGVLEFVDRSARAGELLCYRVRPLASRSAADWSTEVCAEAREPAPGAGAAASAGAPGSSGAAASGTAAAPAPATGTASGEPGAPASQPTGERRVRAGGGWLQVLE